MTGKNNLLTLFESIFDMNTLNRQDDAAIGIDIGGSHITIAIVDLKIKKIVKGSVRRKTVDRHGTAEAILSAWADMINMTIEQAKSKINKIGFAMPGPFDYEKGISYIKGLDKFEALYGLNIREEIAARTGIEKESIVFRNDADAFLEGECFCGACSGYSKVVGLTLGTGLGSCNFVNGEIENCGLHAMPFKDATAEDYISTRWFERTYMQYSGKQVTGVKPIADHYFHDEFAALVFNEFAANLSQLLLHCINTYEPEAIVLGGNIAHAAPLFIEKVRKDLSSIGRVPKIEKAILGENAALIGAASSFAVASSVQ